ncbi:MFS transporter [Candidatus Woesearchaeota archaeon]|nr:MFS transporter [Candidatus Woesearchaeota archaeon]
MVQSQFSYQQHLVAEYAAKKELLELYISMFIRNFAFSMAGLFVPLYLYSDLGLPLRSVVLFYLTWTIGMGIFTPICAKLSHKFGIKHSMLFSMPFTVAYFFLMDFLKTTDMSYMVPAIVYSFGSAWFWIAFNTAFTKCSDCNNRGKQVGIWFFTSYIAGIIGPFVGGLILLFFNFQILFFIVGALLFCSMIPLFFTKDTKSDGDFKISRVFDKKYLQFAPAYFSDGIRYSTIVVLWPIFIFIILGAYIQLGAIGSIATLIAAFWSYAVGKFADHGFKIKVMKIGGITDALVWFFGWIFAKFGMIALGIITSLETITYTLISVPLTVLAYDVAAKNEKGIEVLISREFFLTFGRALMLLIIFGLTFLNADIFTQMIYGFIITGVFSFFYLLV